MEKMIPSESNIDEAIQRNRTARTQVTVTLDGQPLRSQEIVIAQKSHKFLFGSNWGRSVDLINGELNGTDKEKAELQVERFLQLFNQVTMPFYWSRFEPERGKPQTQPILNAARWFQERGCMVKGHPLCWHTLCADWLLPLSNAEILKAQVDRIRRDVSDFAGVIDTWDVINEAVIMPVFDKYDNAMTRLCKDMGRIELIRTVFETARQTNPKATLLLNDFDVSPAFDILVEGCLEAGIQIDVIGIQSHMHQGYWGPERTLEVIEHFERFDLPIHFTENTIVSGQIMPAHIVDLNDYQVDEWPSTPEGEARQMEEVVAHYKTLFAHPMIEAVTWWDLSDGSWLNAPAGLLRKDQSPKPAYEALHQLIKGDWWLAPTRMTTDADGVAAFTGFLGDYELTVGNKTTQFSIPEAGDCTLTVEAA